MSTDPNATLTEIRDTTRLIREDADAGIDTALDRLDHLEQLITDLDAPLSRGGFLPDAWGDSADATVARVSCSCGNAWADEPGHGNHA